MSSSTYYNARLEKERRDRLAQEVENKIKEVEIRMKKYRASQEHGVVVTDVAKNRNEFVSKIHAGSRQDYKAVDVHFALNVSTDSESNPENLQEKNIKMQNLQNERTFEIIKSSPVNRLKKQVSDELSSLNIVTENQREAYDSFVSFFNEIADDKNISNDERKNMVEERLGVLKRKLNTDVTAEHGLFAKKIRLEALMKLLDVNSGISGTLDEQIDKLEKALMKQEENKMIMAELSDVMQNLGYQMESNIIINDDEIELWDSDTTWCDLGIKREDSIFIIDTVVNGEKNSITANQMREVESEARAICDKKRIIAEEMSKRGIRFDIISDNAPEKSNLKYNARKSKEKKKRRSVENKYMSIN